MVRLLTHDSDNQPAPTGYSARRHALRRVAVLLRSARSELIPYVLETAKALINPTCQSSSRKLSKFAIYSLTTETLQINGWLTCSYINLLRGKPIRNYNIMPKDGQLNSNRQSVCLRSLAFICGFRFTICMKTLRLLLHLRRRKVRPISNALFQESNQCWRDWQFWLGAFLELESSHSL